jgi:hypothetical protein
MPQLRSYQSGAGTPNIGSAFVGGAKVGAEIEDSRSRAANARAAIAQQAVEANMRASAAQAALQQQAVMKQQEIAIQQAMHTSQLEMKARELDQEQAQQQALGAYRGQEMDYRNRELDLNTKKFGIDQQKFDLESAEAARKNSDIQESRGVVEHALSQYDLRNGVVGTGEPQPMTPAREGVLRGAVQEAGARFPATIPAGVSSLFRQPGGGKPTPEPGDETKTFTDEEGHHYYWNGQGWRETHASPSELPSQAEPILGANGEPTGWSKVGNRVVKNVAPAIDKDILEKKKLLLTQDWLDARAYWQQAKDPELRDQMSKTKLRRADDYAEQLMELKKLERKRDELMHPNGVSTQRSIERGPARATIPEVLTQPSTNKVGRFKVISH